MSLADYILTKDIYPDKYKFAILYEGYMFQNHHYKLVDIYSKNFILRGTLPWILKKISEYEINIIPMDIKYEPYSWLEITFDNDTDYFGSSIY